MSFNTLETYPLNDRYVVVRGDLNMPLQNGKITDDTRLKALLPTLKKLQEKGAKTILLSHLGRPKGKAVPEMSLRSIIPAMEEALGTPIHFFEKTRPNLKAGEIALRENVRFDPREEQNDVEFALELSQLGDIFVQDAFATSHRAHASTVGIAQHIPAVAGLLVEKELKNLTQALETPKRPVIALVGGAKISTKIDLLNNLVKKVDYLVLGGGMANTFLHANNFDMGKSLCEKEMSKTCQDIQKQAKDHGCELILPTDVITALEFAAHAPSQSKAVSALNDNDMALDIGPKTVHNIENHIKKSKTLVWNGPLGAFEIEPFDTGTNTLADYVASRTKSGELLSVAGGGDTVAALNKADVFDSISYISTAGGAFLEWLEGKELPGIEILTTKQD